MTGDGTLTRLVFEPGIYKDRTEYASEGRWSDGDHVRFRDGMPEKIGGWVEESVQQNVSTSASNFLGIVRDMKSYHDLDGQHYLGLGSHSNLMVMTGGTYYDITPIRTTIAGTSSAFEVSAGSTIVRTSIASHGAAAGDYVVFGSVSTSAGYGNTELTADTLINQWVITTVSGTDVLKFDCGVTASVDGILALHNGTAQFLLASGLANNGSAFGWGSGGWGSGTWGVGTTAAGAVAVNLRQWTLEPWGEDLLANVRGGKIYRHNTSAGPTVRASVIDAAPSICDTILVTPERHLVALGCNDSSGVYDSLLVRWSDSEDYTNWAAAVTNAAGSKRLNGGSFIVGRQPTKRETLIFTNSNVHSMRYVGGKFVYGIEELTEKTGGLIAQHAVMNADEEVFWMGEKNFYSYKGVVRVLPSDVDKYVFDADSAQSINRDQKEKIFAGINTHFSEIIWLYPDTTTIECNRYVLYNYKEKHWSIGSFCRTAWEDAGVFDKPYAACPTGQLYIHEEGRNNGASPLDWYVQSAWFDLQDGDDMMFIDKLVPDVRDLNGKSVNFTIETRKYPNDSSVVKGPYQLNAGTKFQSIRTRGRQARVRFSSSITNAGCELGFNRLTIQKDGGR